MSMKKVLKWVCGWVKPKKKRLPGTSCRCPECEVFSLSSRWSWVETINKGEGAYHGRCPQCFTSSTWVWGAYPLPVLYSTLISNVP